MKQLIKPGVRMLTRARKHITPIGLQNDPTRCARGSAVIVLRDGASNPRQSMSSALHHTLD